MSAWRNVRVILVAAVVAASGLGLAGFATAKPVAASTCFNHSCTGIDPNGTSCLSDAQRWDITVNDSDLPGYPSGPDQLQTYMVDISPSCGAGWARVEDNVSPYPYQYFYAGYSFEGVDCCASGPQGQIYLREASFRDTEASVHWSNMHAGGSGSPDSWVRTCEWTDYSECTNWH